VTPTPAGPTATPTPTVLAAVPEGPDLVAVAAAARSVAELLHATVTGLHVGPPDPSRTGELSRRAGFPVRTEPGDPVPRLLAATRTSDPVLVVVGARSSARTDAPVGHVALELARGTTAPLLVVPPGSTLGRTTGPARALVPLDDDPRTTAQVRPLVERLEEAGVEIVVTHVFDPAHPPTTMDQPAHAQAAWGTEFLARHGYGSHGLELRRGATWDAVLRCAEDVAADLLVLGWAQHLTPGHARTVRRALDRSRVPVLLVPSGAAIRDGGP
jgi:nucleotide-binding universal stress UspA family protein